MWNEVVMTRQHLKLVYLLCVLHLLESGKDAFRNEIHWVKVVMTWQHLKFVYLLCVLHLLRSGKDAFRNEIHLDKVVMIRQHLKLGYLLSVLHSLGSGKDAFPNEIHLTFDDIDKNVYECMDMMVSLWFEGRHKGEHGFLYHEGWFNLHELSCNGGDTMDDSMWGMVTWLNLLVKMKRWMTLFW